MLQAIRSINRVLQQLDKQFGLSAQGIQNAAQKISQSVQAVKSMRSGGMGRGGLSTGRGSGNNADQNPFGLQDLGSVAFSGIAGAWQIMFAKISTRVLQGFSNKFLGNHPLNPASPQNQNASSMPIGAQKQWEDYLGKLGSRFLMLLAAIYAVIKAFQLLKDAIEAIIKSFKSQVNLFMDGAKGNPAMYQQLRGIAAKLNASPEEISKVAGDTGGRGFIAKLKGLQNASSDESAAWMAKAMGIPEDWAYKVRTPGFKFPKEGDAEGGILNPKNRRAYAEFESAMGDLKLAFEDLKVEMVVAIRQVTMWLKYFTFQLRMISNFIKGFLNPQPLWGGKPEDKFGKAVDKFSEDVDKWTRKRGTHGGGDRGRNPIPRAWIEWGHKQTLIDQADRMGAFEF